jgi:phosphatidylglycerophosphatase A
MTAFDRVRALTVSCLGLGYAPVASGTFGTLGAVGIVLLMRPLRDESWFHFGGAMVLLSVLAMVVGVALGPWAEHHYGRKDPSPFVLDELLGYFVTVFRVGEGFPGAWELAVAFFTFRLFDVIKPPPGRQLEQLQAGWGIMLDDLAAGVYSWMFVSTLRLYLEWP